MGPDGERQPWRQLCGVRPSWWGHARRAEVVRALRAAGYHCRRPDRKGRGGWPRRLEGFRQAGHNPATGEPYQIPDWRYTAGPVEGLPAVDPWDVARRLDRCGGAWRVWLRSAASGPVLLPLPDVCRSNACPVCAARRSARLASSIRLLIAARWGVGTHRTAFLTLTHRARRGESLARALERWRGAWSRLTRGRSGQRWRELVEGWFYGVEVTRGAGSSRLRRGPHWHVHGHAVIRLKSSAEDDRVQTEIQRRWVSATAAAAAGMGYARPDHWAHDPASGHDRHGVCRWWRWIVDPGGWEPDPDPEVADRRAVARVRSGDAAELAESDALSAVYQACKYPTPIADLCPLSLAEWLAVARGRRWHDGGGVWRGAIGRADRLREYIRQSVDLGRTISTGSPHDLPLLDAAGEDIGRSVPVRVGPRRVELVETAGPVRPRPGGLLGWKLRGDLDDETRAGLVAAGLELWGTADSPIALAPSAWAHERIHELDRALSDDDDAGDRATAGPIGSLPG
jgi:hypothetical protein